MPLVWPGISHVNAVVLAGAERGITLVDCGTAGDPPAGMPSSAGSPRRATGSRTSPISSSPTRTRITSASRHRVVAESGCTMWMHPAHEAFTDSALEPERIHAARERRARAEGVPEDVIDQYADTGEETDFALTPLPAFTELHSGMQVPVRARPVGRPRDARATRPPTSASTSRRSDCSSSATSSRASSHPGTTTATRPTRSRSWRRHSPSSQASTSTWHFPATAARSRTSPRSSRCTRTRSSERARARRCGGRTGAGAGVRDRAACVRADRRR